MNNYNNSKTIDKDVHPYTLMEDDRALEESRRNKIASLGRLTGIHLHLGSEDDTSRYGTEIVRTIDKDVHPCTLLQDNK